MPESAVTAPGFTEFANKFFFFSGAVGAKGITGYHVDANKASKPLISASEIWKIDFPEGETIAAVSRRPSYGESRSPSDGKWMGSPLLTSVLLVGRQNALLRSAACVATGRFCTST